MGYRGLYLEATAYPFGAPRDSHLEHAIRGVDGLGPWLDWRLAELASTGSSGLVQSLRRCSRHYALDRRDPREGLARQCDWWLSRPADSPAFGQQPPEHWALIKATREWLAPDAS